MNKWMNSTAIKLSLVFALLFVLGCQRQIILFDGKNLDNWERTDFAGKGDVRIDENGSLVLEIGAEFSGVSWK